MAGYTKNHKRTPMYIAADSAIFGLGTHFKYSGAGDGVNPSGGTLYYQLPGPAGHWLPNAMCNLSTFGAGLIPA